MREKLSSAALLLVALSLAACQADSQSDKAKANPPTIAAKNPADADVAAIGGTGVPDGYVGRTDRANMPLSDAKYLVSGNGWDVTTGPAHILYMPGDTATGSYTVTATIDQLAAPAHPEAYGIFIGGQALDGDAQKYLYFLVRGTGEMLAKVREGDKTRGVVAWTASDAVPKAGTSGQATYKVTIQVRPDSVRFWVNGRQTAAVASAGLPTTGVYGIRINHNLHVRATPVTLTRP
jgi:hypothetical protein